MRQDGCHCVKNHCEPHPILQSTLDIMQVFTVICVEIAIVIDDSEKEDLEEVMNELFDDDDVCWMDASTIDLDMIIQELEKLKAKINDIINKLQ